VSLSILFIYHRYSEDPEPRNALPKSRSLTTTATTDELIDLTRPPPPAPSDSSTATRFSFDLPPPASHQHSRQGSADSSGTKQQLPQTPYYHFGERGSGQAAAAAQPVSSKKLSLPVGSVGTPGPAKPRRDWSSLAASSSSASLVAHDYVNVRLGGGQQQQQQLEPESSSGGGSFHARQSSNDSSTSRSGVGVGRVVY
jgi:hypothetical protein